MFFPILKNSTVNSRIFIFILLVVFGFIFSNVLSAAVLLLGGDTFSELGKLRMAQACGQIVGFIMPPLFYAALVKERPLNYLGFKAMPAWGLLGIVIMLAVIPFNDMMTHWNEGFTLPESMAGLEKIIRESNELMKETMKKFFSDSSINGLIINILIMGVFAAVGEELLFRSALQPFFVRICKNAYIGIAITAILFSAIHLEFYGFIPRLILGFMLGYMYHISGSIWTSILMHFVNNSTIVVIYFLNINNITNIDIETTGLFGTGAVICSLIATVAIIIYCRHLSTKKQQ